MLTIVNHNAVISGGLCTFKTPVDVMVEYDAETCKATFSEPKDGNYPNHDCLFAVVCYVIETGNGKRNRYKAIWRFDGVPKSTWLTNVIGGHYGKIVSIKYVYVY